MMVKLNLFCGFLCLFIVLYVEAVDKNDVFTKYLDTVSNLKLVKVDATSGPRQGESSGERNRNIFKILHSIVKRNAAPDPRRGESADGKNQNVLKIIHNIVKRNAAPDPRPRPQPKGGGGATGKTEEKGHESLFVRKDLKVNAAGVAFTAIAFLLVFAITCVLVICYWKKKFI